MKVGMFHADGMQKKAGLAKLTSDKMEFRLKGSRKRLGRALCDDNGVIQSEKIITTNIGMCTPNIRTSNL